jgi:hypothetical protein
MAKLNEKTFRTTTLEVPFQTSFQHLDRDFALYRYTLPPNIQSQYRNGTRNSKTILFAQIHSALKEQLAYPYKSFQNARIDGKKTWVVYVLCPQGEQPPNINLKNSRFALQPARMSFDEMWKQDWFNLLKLLQISYFRGVESNYFVGRDECYVYVKPRPRFKDSHICILMKLSGSERANRQLRIIGEAHTFRRVTWLIDNGKENFETYYGVQITDGQLIFIQLIPDEIRSYVDAGKPIYISKSFEGTRTHLDYHSQGEIENSRGYILQTFIEGYIDYLQDYGIAVSPLKRTFYRFESSQPDLRLPLDNLGQVYVYDVRHNQAISRENYLRLFTQILRAQELRIELLPIENVQDASQGAVLILQDSVRQAYQENGVLYQHALYQDPYPNIYERFTDLPKQFFNVNTNKNYEQGNVETYLTYPMLQEDDIRHSLIAILNQLFLKEVVLRKRNVQAMGMPFSPINALFIRKATYDSRSYEVLMYFENNVAQFLPIFKEDSREQRESMVAKLGLNWNSLYEQLLNKYKPNRTEEENNLPDYDLILAPNICIDVEDLQERVLYDYEGIISRQQERGKKRPVGELKLSHRLNDERWREFDDVLDEIAPYSGLLSIEDLWEDEAVKLLAPILEVKLKDGKISKQAYMRALYRPYQKLELFPSPKDDSLHMFEGIWYTHDNCYMVGSAHSLDQKQPRAHLIRRFDFLEGEFDPSMLQSLLDATSVLFVRLDEYTVFPYYFHLIDIFVENQLKYQIINT